jgi:hypothetical protein
MEKSRREVCYARAGVFGPNHHAIAITAEHGKKIFFLFSPNVSRLLYIYFILIHMAAYDAVHAARDQQK